MGSNRGTAAMRRLQAVGDRELLDSRLPEAVRDRLKRRVERWAITYSPEEMMFLAGALEHQAKHKASR